MDECEAYVRKVDSLAEHVARDGSLVARDECVK